MLNLIRNRLAAAIIAATAIGSFAGPALAGTCPPGQERDNALPGRATEPSKVTDDVLGAIDLGKEIGVGGRELRLRRLVLQPGGIVPFHSHAGRPALILTVSGQVTEYRTSCAVPITHKAGELSREADGIGHYWRNEGRVPAVLLSADVKGEG